MSEEDLEVLITLDDPEGTEEDTFNHPPTENSLEYWLDQPSRKLDQANERKPTEK